MFHLNSTEPEPSTNLACSYAMKLTCNLKAECPSVQNHAKVLRAGNSTFKKSCMSLTHDSNKGRATYKFQVNLKKLKVVAINFKNDEFEVEMEGDDDGKNEESKE